MLGASRRSHALAFVAAVAVGLSCAGAAPAWAAPPPAPRDGSSTVAQQQVAVVTRDHQAPISAAQNAVDTFTQAVTSDRSSLQASQAEEVTAAADLRRDQVRLTTDEQLLAEATTARHTADATLAADRARLGSIAVGVYTGALSPPDLATITDFQAAEEQVLDDTQVALVAQIIDDDIHRDLLTDDRDIAVEKTDQDTVAGDSATVATDQSDEVSAQAGVGLARAALSSDENRLATADDTLGAAEDALTAALSSLAGPTSTPAGQLSLIGGSALGPSQLVSWFDYEGYVDLTSAPISQLASWYIQFGAEEGVRGDVAFAQAVLETGGFSSPDAVNLSNFAGIGHCDSCSAGWQFPSPAGGVLGQIQLLRIFADDGPPPAGAPGPVLPQLTTANQYESGCCSTVQSLTGVWATDPTYGTQIMAIYSQMLDYALSAG